VIAHLQNSVQNGRLTRNELAPLTEVDVNLFAQRFLEGDFNSCRIELLRVGSRLALRNARFHTAVLALDPLLDTCLHSLPEAVRGNAASGPLACTVKSVMTLLRSNPTLKKWSRN
jgi:hypothetical protein